MDRLSITETKAVDNIPFGNIDGVIKFLADIKREKEDSGFRNVKFDYRWIGHEDFEFFISHDRDETDEEVEERSRDDRRKKKIEGIAKAREKRINEEKRNARIAELRAEIDSLA